MQLAEPPADCCLPQGVLFHDRILPEHLQRERAKLVQMEEDFLQQHPGALIRRLPELPSVAAASTGGKAGGFRAASRPVKKGFS
jgi:hypothetical protein